MAHDKADWHIDGGEDEDEVYARFQSVFEFLDENNMLTEEGKEEFENGIDDSTIISEDHLTSVANEFFTKYYDTAIEDNPSDMKKTLSKYLKKFLKK